MQKKLLALLCVFIMVLAVVSGCYNTAKKPYTTPSPKPAPQTDNTSMTSSERRVLANNLSQMAQGVSGVQTAIVAISSIAVTTSTSGQANQNGITKMNGTTQNQVNSSKQNTVENNLSKNEDSSGVVAMVGITLSKNVMKNTKQMNDTKIKVVNKLKSADKRISQVLVTTDPTLIKRINDVAAGIIEGKPIKTYQTDVNEIAKQLRQEKPAY